VTTYLLYQLDESGAIESTVRIDAETMAEALKHVVDCADGATYELWSQGIKVATIETSLRPRAECRRARSWLDRLVGRLR
jgi:hypothetical protein